MVFPALVWARPGRKAMPRFLLFGLGAATLAVAVFLFSGGFARYRISRSLSDLEDRKAHWSKALGLMEAGLATRLIGMGFGRYPSVYLEKAKKQKPPGTYEIKAEGDNHYLRLGAGEPLYLDQIVDVEAGDNYILSARIRGQMSPAVLAVPLCEKALLYSFSFLIQNA